MLKKYQNLSQDFLKKYKCFHDGTKVKNLASSPDIYRSFKKVRNKEQRFYGLKIDLRVNPITEKYVFKFKY